MPVSILRVGDLDVGKVYILCGEFTHEGVLRIDTLNLNKHMNKIMIGLKGKFSSGYIVINFQPTIIWVE